MAAIESITQVKLKPHQVAVLERWPSVQTELPSLCVKKLWHSTVRGNRQVCVNCTVCIVQILCFLKCVLALACPDGFFTWPGVAGLCLYV